MSIIIFVRETYFGKKVCVASKIISICSPSLTIPPSNSYYSTSHPYTALHIAF